MSVNYGYPTPQELKEIERTLLPALTTDDWLFDDFPLVETNSWRLAWRQRDNYQGLQQIRGLGGSFKTVAATGIKEYSYEPAVYGEKSIITEDEITKYGKLDSYTDFIPINDLVGDRVDQLIQRRLDRVRKTLVDLLTTGTFTVTDRAGTVIDTATYPIQTASASVAWSTLATAKPYADITALRLKAKGLSTSFGKGSKLWMNPVTFGYLIGNANTSDLFGRRTQYGATLNSVTEINKLMREQSGLDDLPEIAVYDRAYYSDGADGLTAGTPYYFLPDNKCVLVGKRLNNAPLGEYRMTRNSQNENASPGAYMYVRDTQPFQSPRSFEVEDGHNGGPVIYFPGSVLVLTVS